MGQAQRNPNL